MEPLALGIPGGQGWAQFGDLGLAFVLSGLIGLERELRQKWAGLRTHILVGVASALIMLVSKYGFSDVLAPGRITLDPSRVAAQIVSGIGFLGAGLIFVRRDAVRGLTTAAVTWATAAVGMACGAGLAILAVGGTGLYFVTLYGFTPLARRLPGRRSAESRLGLVYRNGRGVLREILVMCTGLGFTVVEIAVEPGEHMTAGDRELAAVTTADGSHPGMVSRDGGPGRFARLPATVSVRLTLSGTQPVTDLVASLSELAGVLAVDAGSADEDS